MKAMIISFVCVLTFATQSLSAQNLTLEVRGIENVVGKLYVAIYNSQETFMKKPLAGFAVEVKDKVVSIPCKGFRQELMPFPCIRMRMEMANWIPALSVFLWRSLVSVMMPKALWAPLPTKNAVLPSLKIQL
jgi:hypothetical protein